MAAAADAAAARGARAAAGAAARARAAARADLGVARDPLAADAVVDAVGAGESSVTRLVNKLRVFLTT